VPCSNAANIGERKTWTQSEFCSWQNSVRQKSPPKMYTYCTSQTSCKVLLISVKRRRCSKEAKTRNRLKFVLCPKLANRSQPLVGQSSPYCGDMWRRYCFLTSFFPIVDICLCCKDIARQSCAMVPRWRFLGDFLRPVFSAIRVHHISHMHSKFALRPHHV